MFMACDQCFGDQFDIRLEHLGSVTAERGADRWLRHIVTFIIFEKKKNQSSHCAARLLVFPQL